MHTQITLEERYAINVMRKHRYSIRAMARELGRAPSTISRELRRNLRPTGRYVPDIAHSYATARRRRSRRNARISGGRLLEMAYRRIQECEHIQINPPPLSVVGSPNLEDAG